MEEEKVKKQKSKARKSIEWIGTIILGIIFAVVATFNVAKLLTRNEYGQGNSFGITSYVVLTDSMEPKYKTDSVIIAYKESPENIVKRWNEIKDLNLELTDDRNINMTFVDAYQKKVDSGNPLYYDQTTPLSQSSGQPVVMTHQLFNIIVDESIPEGQGRYTFLVHGINISEHQAMQGQYQAFTEKEYLGVVKSNSTFLGGISRFLSSVWGLLICLLIPSLYLIITSVLDIFKAYKEEDEEPALEGATSTAGSSKLDSLSEKEREALKQQMIDEMLKGKGGKK